MSWQAYLDNLIGRGNIEKAAIFGQNGSQWAASPGFTIQPQEAIDAFNCMKNGSTPTGSVTIAGQKWMVTRCDEECLYGASGKQNICICSTKQALVIATSNKDAGHTPNVANNNVQAIADYLSESGY